MQRLRIAGLRLRVEGYELGGVFRGFAEEDAGQPADVVVRVITRHDYSAHLPAGDMAQYELPGVRILQDGARQVFLSSNSVFYCTVFAADYTRADCYFHYRAHRLEDVRQQVDDFLFVELRKLVIGRLHCRGGLMLHSASVLFRGGAVALAAKAGTGKTTHAALWVRLFGARIIDGDTNALRPEDGGVRLYGLPWCGTSGICRNESAPLRAVVFLEQAPHNEAVLLGGGERVMRLAARSLLPLWDMDLMRGDYLAPARETAARTACYLLRCKPDAEAAEVLMRCLY